MKILSSIPILTFILLLALGCTQRHRITINPDLPVTPADIGNSRVIGLKVIDARSSNVIAKWKGRFNVRKFTVSPNEDVREILFRKVRQGLEMLGFHARPARTESNPQMRLEILQIRSLYQEQIPHLHVRIRSAFRITCKNRGRTYQNVYTDKKDRQNIIPSTFPNENLINASLSGNLQKMFADQKLLSCLAD